MQNRKSIVLVTVDCLRADHVSFMGYQRPTTPFLDTLAHESYVFSNAIVGGVPTYYSLPTILGSRYPLALGRDVLGMAPGEQTLATVLRSAGYSTAAFSAANPYISSRFGYDQGFDTFRDFLKDHSSPAGVIVTPQTGWVSRANRELQSLVSGMGALRKIYDELYFHYCQRVTPAAASLDALRRFPAADEIVDLASSWLDSLGDEPFFLWLHLMDPHSPYYPKQNAIALMENDSPSPSRARYLNSYWNRSDLGPERLEACKEEVIHLYDASVRWVDLQMARLMEKLRQAKRWESCIFALTADHGEEFLDHGGRYHPPSKLTEELIHVPLLIRVPGAKGVRVGQSPFSLLHLAPTLLEASDVPVPAEFRGRSHWTSLRDNQKSEGVAISECADGCTNPFRSENRMGSRLLSVREERFKLTFSFNPINEQLYDLEADPAERAPLAASEQQSVRRRLLEVAREHVRQSRENREWRMRVRAQLREIPLEWKAPLTKASPIAS